MGRGVNGDHPVLDVIIEQWPSLIFLPAILGLIVALVAVTRWWDQRDKSRLADEEARRADAPARPTRDEVITPPPPRPGDRRRHRWRQRPAATVHGTPSAPTSAIYPSVEHPPKVPPPMAHTHRETSR
jgi:hypothetical protein